MRERHERPNLTRLTRLRFVNAYLVAEDDGLTLVDTMLSGSAQGIQAAAGRLGRPIARIVLTHAHGDHAGSLDAMAARLPGVEIAVSGRESRLLAGDRSLAAGEPDSPLRGSWAKVETRPTRLLEAGDRVGSLRVVAAPGHTPGQIALFDERDGTLIAGDAFSTLGGVSTAGRTNPRFPFVGMATWDRPTANRTAAMLRRLEPAALAVGHGPVIADPAAAIDRALLAAGVDVRMAAQVGPRRGLSRVVVVDAAAQMADEHGFDGLTLGAVAAQLGVRPPSLYNHVEGLDGLRRDLALQGLRELDERIRDAAVGRAGEEAMVALAVAYRAYARERPGRYRALQRAPDPDDAEVAAAAERLLRPVLAVLAGYGLEGDAAIPAARSLRSAMHGFVELERLGGFGIDLDVDRSYRWMIAALSAGLRQAAARTT